MTRAAIRAALAFTAVLQAGCGTFLNTCYFNLADPDGGSIYGGTRIDVSVIANTGVFEPGETRGSQLGKRELAALVFIDLPFSLVGDTLTLPLTIPISLWVRPAFERECRQSVQSEPLGTLSTDENPGTLHSASPLYAEDYWLR